MASRNMMTLAVGLMLALLPASVWGQTSNPSPDAAGPLEIQVTAVQGAAQYRPRGEMKWKTLAVGAKLTEGTEFRTGPKGAIQFTVGTDQVYRVDRLTVVKVLRANLGPDGTIRTDVGMEYGRVSKDVDSPVRPHEDTIVSPASTLAVRGTRVSLYDQPPYEAEAVSLTGAAVFTGLGRQLTAFGAKGEGTAAVSTDNPDAATNSLDSRIVDPSTANARTPAEQRLLGDLVTTGAVVNVNNPDTLPTVSDTIVPTDGELATLTPGNLVFYIRWNTDTHVQMELIASAGPGHLGEFILPVLGLDRSPAGGQILFDNLGGPQGGFEVITYPNSFPTGAYTIAANNVGNLNTTVTFNAFVTGTRVSPPSGPGLVPQALLDLNSGSFQPKQQVVASVPAGSSYAVVAQVPEAASSSFPAAAHKR